MLELFYDWSMWIFAAIGAIVAIWGIPKLMSRTTNQIDDGDFNDQSGGKGTTDNKIGKGNNNKQTGA